MQLLPAVGEQLCFFNYPSYISLVAALWFTPLFQCSKKILAFALKYALECNFAVKGIEMFLLPSVYEKRN